jgi:uncharacterized protein with LGFP repeats
MPGSYIDHLVWEAGEAGEFNLDSAIYRYWRELRMQGKLLGLPITDEINTEVGVQQGFSSGAVIGWDPEQGAYLASDA